MAIRGSSRTIFSLRTPTTPPLLTSPSSSQPFFSSNYKTPQEEIADDDETLISDVAAILREQRSKSRWGFLRSLYHTTGFTPRQVSQITLRLRSNPRLSLRFFTWCESNSLCRHDLLSYSTIIHILARARLKSAARALIQAAIRAHESHGDGHDDPSGPPEILRTLAQTYRACDSAPFVFDLLIQVSLRARKIDRALAIVRLLRSWGIYPTVGTCNELIQTVSKARGSETGLDIYNEIFKGGGTRVKVSPNVQTFNALLLSLYRDTRLKEAEEILLAEMKEFSCEPNAFTFNILMACYCDEGDMEGAKAMWEEMTSKQIKPDLVSYNTLIRGCCETGEMERAEALFREMVVAGIDPTCITHEHLIKGYCMIGKVDDAFLLYREMRRKDYRPEISTVDELIGELCTRKRVVEGLGVLREEMRRGGLHPSRTSYQALIKGFCAQGRMEEALKLQPEMVGKGFEPDSEIYNAFIQGYMEQGCVEKVEKLKDEMLKLGD